VKIYFAGHPGGNFRKRERRLFRKTGLGRLFSFFHVGNGILNEVYFNEALSGKFSTGK
jgi:hypothetical protein